jgi:hypothetical protein
MYSVVWSLVRAKLMLGTILIAQFCAAQVRVGDEGRAFMDTVLTIDGSSSTMLYERAREWMLRNLKSADSQISLEDKDGARLIANANLLLPEKPFKAGSKYTQRVLNYKISVFLKEGRYRVIIENIIYSYVFVVGRERTPEVHAWETWLEKLKEFQYRDKPQRLETIQDTVRDVDSAISGMLSSLHAAMTGEKDGLHGDW